MKEANNQINNTGFAHLLIVVFVSLLAIGTAVGLYLLSNRNTDIPFVPTQNQKKSLPTPNTTSLQVTKNANVEIVNDKLVPESLQIKKGSVVTFVNKDSKTHQIVLENVGEGKDKDLEADPLVTNGSMTYTFSKAGTFNFHDKSTLNLKGFITVVN